MYHALNLGFVTTEHFGGQRKKRSFRKGLSEFLKARSRRNCQKAEKTHRLLEWCQRKTFVYTSLIFYASVITYYKLFSEAEQQIRWPLV